MSTSRLSLVQLVRALERYGDKYDAFDVFANDVEELYALGDGRELDPALNARPEHDGLVFRAHGKCYRLALTEKSGMARIARIGEVSVTDAGFSGNFKNLGRLSATAIALATSAKGEGWLPGLFIGVLAAHEGGQSGERTVTVRYDAASRQWRAYGGAMSQWLREAAAS